MENKPLSQEERMKEFTSNLSIDYMESGSALTIQEVINKAIQFGSELRAERVKDKIDILLQNCDEAERVAYNDSIKAIEESKI